MNDTTDPSHFLQQPVPAAPMASLRVDYTTTRIIREAGYAIRATPGVIGMGRSELSDAIKVLRTQVLQRMRSQGWNSLAITSPRQSRSKSILAVNLALSLAAEFDKTALLVDTDLGSPQLSALFQLGTRKGLSDHLLEGAPLGELIVNPGIEHFVLLPAGNPVLNSAELLATDASTRLFQEFKNRYAQRYVIFDAPPVLTADALSLFEKVDAILFVAERGSTTRADLRHCAQLLDRFPVVGSVMCEALNEGGDLVSSGKKAGRVEPRRR
jgi:Mrp family chromosome partitioning ATPase